MKILLLADTKIFYRAMVVYPLLLVLAYDQPVLMTTHYVYFKKTIGKENENFGFTMARMEKTQTMGIVTFENTTFLVCVVLLGSFTLVSICSTCILGSKNIRKIHYINAYGVVKADWAHILESQTNELFTNAMQRELKNMYVVILPRDSIKNNE
ncbi:hypothetical protein GQX74_011758 [Glossina fuscipes]|nr:hypothetical protein GQX74_011758 [Glossina fuscipes]